MVVSWHALTLPRIVFKFQIRFKTEHIWTAKHVLLEATERTIETWGIVYSKSLDMVYSCSMGTIYH